MLSALAVRGLRRLPAPRQASPKFSKTDSQNQRLIGFIHGIYSWDVFMGFIHVSG